jgi:hypothetical protein
MVNRVIWLAALAYCLLIAEKPAHAYIDPGSASYVYQIVAGAALGAAFLVRTYWQRLITKCRSLLSRDPAQS